MHTSKIPDGIDREKLQQLLKLTNEIGPAKITRLKSLINESGIKRENSPDRADKYLSEDLKRKLGPWNCFNPRIAFKLLYPTTDEAYLPLIDSDKRYQIPNIKDYFVKRLNQEYFERLDLLIATFKIDDPLVQLKALYELKEILGYYNDCMDLFPDLLRGKGLFEKCSFYLINGGELAKYGNAIIMREEYIFDYTNTTSTDIKIPLEDYLRNKWSKQMDIITEGSGSIPGIEFRNPWRQALEKEFDTKTIENAGRLLRIMKDKPVKKIVEPEKHIHPKEIIELARKAHNYNGHETEFNNLQNYVKSNAKGQDKQIRLLYELNPNLDGATIANILNTDPKVVYQVQAYKELFSKKSKKTA